METRLTRKGDGWQRWYIGDTPMKNGQPTIIGDGWTAIASSQGSRNMVTVLRGDELQYECNISRTEAVWLFDNGAATLAKENPAHMALARVAVDALAQRRAGPGILVSVSILPPNKTVNGMSFRTKMSSNNYFTDGTITRLGGAQGRVTKRCVGGSYLVYALRHVDLTIFAVEITAQANYNTERLAHCLRHLG